MNTHRITRQRQRRRLSSGSRSRTWRGVLFLAVIVLLNLACINTTTIWEVFHQEGQEDRVAVTLSRHMTEEYLAAARSANAARAIDYGDDQVEDIFPDSLEEARMWLATDTHYLYTQL